MKPTILHLENAQTVTGSYKALLSYCTGDADFRHVWVLPEGSAIVEEARQHLTVYTLPFVEIGRSAGRLVGYLPALLRNARRLRRIIAAEKPALLHANDLYNLLPYAARRGGKQRLPIAVHARMLRSSFPGPIYDFWVRWHLRRADAVIAVSEAVKRDWKEDSRVQVVYDPIHLEERLPPYRAGQQGEGETFRFLYLANYMDGKGQDDALKAARLLLDRGLPGFRIDFFGGGTGLEKNRLYKASLEAAAREAGLQDIVFFGGPVQDVEAVMKDYDAALHFSRAESFGMVCYEALWYGLPVISSDCGGPREMMQPGVSGLLLPTGDVAAYADAMQALMQHPGQRASLSAAARSLVRQKFSAASQDALSPIFARLISAAASR